MTETVLSLENVVKRYGGLAAVDGLSFAVARGEIFGFLGPNGAGKTTTLRMILGIIPPTAGRITVLDSISAIPVRHRLGYLPEERGLYRKMRAAETIAYFAHLRGVPARAAKKKAHELLERFGLADFARAKNEALSKGMAQKVQLLATIAHEPELLILDEPFSGLDPINQTTLEALIRDLKAEGRTIIFSTHVMQHAERLCDRFLIIASGRKRFEGDLAAARAAFPPRLLLRTRDPVDPLAAAPGVREIVALGETTDGEREYEIVLERGADPQLVLKAAFEAGIRLSSFERAGASLHDIFVALAGEKEDEQACAMKEAAE
ncbi:ABC transporter ATP-binding protein [Amphiplicatus metriothermophilus]|uniref:ABC-2 type transport system ATP-binding protein n=1 Tax=Amphiplicatus metriothermophilus TaxID=1519374 RepID=A0A239PK27_9PROT|nr:ATP-binding cassette domain-containing protein [Amphiplicatus metriothermophilus]MBB5517987.1 ABC-2 type transport system ATP-binding protein [Amphiplicatus metriothermophilus]SNT67679.1 ABC-2 type transport system ATP-binding protein [Amphiplicatus metriothermophilus]